MQGPYPVIRAALRARGWVERRLPRSSQPAVHCHGDEDEDGDDCDDSNDDTGGWVGSERRRLLQLVECLIVVKLCVETGKCM